MRHGSSRIILSFPSPGKRGPVLPRYDVALARTTLATPAALRLRFFVTDSLDGCHRSGVYMTCLHAFQSVNNLVQTKSKPHPTEVRTPIVQKSFPLIVAGSNGDRLAGRLGPARRVRPPLPLTTNESQRIQTEIPCTFLPSGVRLTLRPVANIIDCTSLLWRANQPGKLRSAGF